MLTAHTVVSLSPQRPVPVVQTVGCPAEISERELQVAADPGQPLGRSWRGSVELPRPSGHPPGFPPQPWRKMGWHWELPPLWWKHAGLWSPWCHPLGPPLPHVGFHLPPRHLKFPQCREGLSRSTSMSTHLPPTSQPRWETTPCS